MINIFNELINFFNELIVRNNFWHIPLLILLWVGFISFLIWWGSALFQFIERKMKKRYGTIWWPVVVWNSLCRFFAKPKKWKGRQIIIIGLLLSIFFLQHFGYRAEAGRGFHRGCEQVKRVLTLQVALERMCQKAQMSEKKVWWETSVKLLLKVARVAGTVKRGADAITTIKDTTESIDNLIN